VERLGFFWRKRTRYVVQVVVFAVEQYRNSEREEWYENEEWEMLEETTLLEFGEQVEATEYAEEVHMRELSNQEDRVRR